MAQNGAWIEAMRFERLPLRSAAFVPLSLIATMLVASVARASELSDFKHPLDNSPLEFKLLPNEVETPAVKKFKETGVNDYRDDAAAIAEGKRLYTTHCVICHGVDVKGTRMGPTLLGPDRVYKQAQSDPGMFSIIYAGATGVMQSFNRRRMPQDQMLRIIAYVRSLDK
jgi:cytochrome c-L